MLRKPPLCSSSSARNAAVLSANGHRAPGVLARVPGALARGLVLATFRLAFTTSGLAFTASVSWHFLRLLGVGAASTGHAFWQAWIALRPARGDLWAYSDRVGYEGDSPRDIQARIDALRAQSVHEGE